ncbi:Tat pathway signal sequence domain protein [Streptomyces sp. DSM 15324]|uniref:Tat pathway signal sequence domain protein n=1 Tax=Streptomyces sp. DSM 15324 TaxID=1739111 RepID=UPI00074B1677|nr:Tat pathway signal sequence domain protein [Streptomyces sp. DSM 15324]KUO13403.1 Tat pathway signal sequence domain protein [Streptomyces sp. DSM 15324]
MSGIGPIEPGEGTHAWDTHPAEPPAVTPAAPGTPPPRLRRLLADRRRAALAALLVVGLLTLCALLYATRPQEREPAVSRPPFPAQVVDVTYLGEHSVPPGTRPHTFAFEVLLSVDSGPPVTVTRVSQPYAGASLTSVPRAPFRTEAGSARTIVITMHVAECGTVPENAGLPFIDVTLRNTRAIQQQSFILGPRYAHDLSRALEVACSNESP